MLYSFRKVGAGNNLINESFVLKTQQTLPDLWRFTKKCCQKCRLQIIISGIAILINIPAFFEITALPCILYFNSSNENNENNNPTTRFSYMVELFF